jgi:hypothetical protein
LEEVQAGLEVMRKQLLEVYTVAGTEDAGEQKELDKR